MANATEELDLKVYLICVNFNVDLNSHSWPVALALTSTVLGTQSLDEEIHVNQGSRCYAMALPKFQGHREEKTALAWGVAWDEVTGGFPERVISEPSLEEGEVGRRGGILKYTQMCWISQQGWRFVSTLVEIKTCNQDPGSSLSYAITRAHPRRMKEYWIQACVHCFCLFGVFFSVYRYQLVFDF